MKFSIRHSCEDFNSYRAARVKSLFNATTGYNWSKDVDLPIEGKDWQIGLIVGASGSGKTSVGKMIAEQLGGGQIYDLYDGREYNKPIIDCISPSGDFNTITAALSSVGLGDVPAWLRPFHVLSNGEKFRAGLARLVCERPELAVVDEFTSVIDRQIAKIGAQALQKTWRRGKGKIILLSCHYDIIEWLQPDWGYDMNEARFFERDCLQQRPPIKVEIYKERPFSSSKTRTTLRKTSTTCPTPGRATSTCSILPMRDGWHTWQSVTTRFIPFSTSTATKSINSARAAMSMTTTATVSTFEVAMLPSSTT